MNSKKINILLVFFIISSLLISNNFGFAEEVDPGSVVKRKVELEEELKKLETEIEGFRSLIQEKQRESTSLERDIAIIDAKTEKAKLEIRARNLAIEKLTAAIDESSQTIDSLIEKTQREKSSLGELLRKVNEFDSVSLLELILGYDNFSDFFIDFDSFETIQDAMQLSFEEIRLTKDATEQKKEELIDKKSEETELRYLQVLEKQRSEQIEAEKKKILDITKGEEAKYQKVLSARQKDAATIRSQLFILTGSPDIPFEKAVEYANIAWRASGVRPAFLLGVIAVESNLGANIGTGNWKIDLSNSRCTKQREAFLKITGELGIDPDLTPVSRRAWYGYCGGAMGPAQFMPTTWLLYKNAVSKITGNNPSSPWDPKDAFVASALLLKDNGAAAGGYTAERRAALRYLAGSRWNKPAYAFYGDDVMSLAVKYQEQINIIQGN